MLTESFRQMGLTWFDYKQRLRAELRVPPFHEVQTLGEDSPNSAGADHFRSDEARQSMWDKPTYAPELQDVALTK